MWVGGCVWVCMWNYSRSIYILNYRSSITKIDYISKQSSIHARNTKSAKIRHESIFGVVITSVNTSRLS